ncbi:sensor histidine kinase [Flexivirga sp.]|uniref:sensor histidine kinase n=1 Tax=Flexivirga sp. TaxID=1962927 RepID=UPI003F7EE24E
MSAEHLATSPPGDTAAGTLIDRRRVAELEAYDVIGREAPAELFELAHLAAVVCSVPSAAINLIDGAQQHSVATYGIPVSVCTRDDSMCAIALHETDTVVLQDARTDERFADNPFVTGALGQVRFYAASQLRTPNGVTIGTLCVFDTRAHPLEPAQGDALDTLARQVMEVLELRRRTAELEVLLAELDAARSELRRSNEQLGGFAHQVSHDLRNPLTAIIGYLEALDDDPAIATQPALAAMVARARRASGRMNDQMTELLDYAQVGGVLGNTTVDLRSVVESVREDLVELIQRREVDLTVHELPSVQGDRVQLHSLVLNLVTNAIKYTPPHRACPVDISGTLRDDVVRVEVADRGIGVAPDQQEQVFELYARSRQLDVEGHGIGLATCRRIVEAHGGTIGLEPRPGGGTIAWFELPTGA